MTDALVGVMNLRRYWLLSGVFLWVDAYQRRKLYKQFVEQAREIRRLRKLPPQIIVKQNHNIAFGVYASRYLNISE